METKQGAPPSGPGYETSDASAPALVRFAIGLVTALVVLALLMAGVFRIFSKTQSLGPPASPFEDVRTLPPQPRLQVEPRVDLQHLRAGEEDLLQSYGWVDPAAGIVRMPIDRAMDRILEKGLPVRATQAATK